MKQRWLFFLAVTISMSMIQDAFAKRAPNIRFDVEVAKGMQHVPTRASVIFSDDSNFSHYDTMRRRYFSICKEGGRYKTGWCETLSDTKEVRNSYLKLILFSDIDTIESNVFRTSTGWPEVKLKIDRGKALVEEKQSSVHKEVIGTALACIVFILFKMGFFFLFYFRQKSLLRSFGMLLLLSAVSLMMMAGLTIGLGAILGLALAVPVICLLEAIVIRGLIFRQSEWGFAILSAALGTITGLGASFFYLLMRSLAE